MTLSRSDKDATLDGPRLAIAGVKDVMVVVANARVRSKSGRSNVPDAGSLLAHSIKRLRLDVIAGPFFFLFFVSKKLSSIPRLFSTECA